MNLTVCPFSGPGSIPGLGGAISRDFSLADHTLANRSEPAMVAHNLWTSRRKAKVQPWIDR